MSELTFRPSDVQALQDALVQATAARQPMGRVDLSLLNGVTAFSADDMTITVQTGITMSDLQAVLEPAGQWLPLDPPCPSETRVADVLRFDISGPRRYGYGTVREHVLGLAAVMADGRLIQSGGRVVKNVAGYDMAKLFIGDGGRLAIPVEVTFKLSPRPVEEQALAWHSSSLDEVEAQLIDVLDGATTPVVLDLHNLDAMWALVVAFAGHPADVAWQRAQLGGTWHPLTDLGYQEAFWAGRHVATTDRTSVLPSRLIERVRTLAPCAVVARAGNGLVYTDRAVTAPARTPSSLERRLEATYDPHHLLGGAR